MYEETLELRNGITVPKLGLGTWLLDDQQTKEAVAAALRLGYRHIDTAQAYGNEQGVGEGLRASGIAREEVFVTTKVAAELKDYESVAESIDESLQKLQLDFIDLVIIHSPQPWASVNQSEDRFFEGNREAWRALEDAYDAGIVHAIGVSNFQVEDIENILASCRVKPMVNQVLAHVGNFPAGLVDWCQEQGIAVEAYSPVGHGAVLGNESVEAISQRYGASIPQVCIRYVLQKGLVALPKTANPEHMASNADVNFTISPADMATLDELAIADYGEASFFPVFGGRL